MIVRTMIVIALGIVSLSMTSTKDWGHFDGVVVARWEPDGRRMTLVEAFSYIEPGDSTRWEAPKGSMIDGASIPPWAWSIVGGPFEGKYRNASVVHDVACDTKTRPWRATHRMFYEAERAGGTGMVRAKIMYAAVYHFGPRWGMDLLPHTLQGKEDLARLQQYIEDHPYVSLDSVDALTATRLRAAEPTIRATSRRPLAESSN